jgi:hypothetical protein
MNDAINPAHYQGFSGGAEVIDITECLPFNTGNAVKYLARAGRKDPARHLEDLQKAAWYVRREIARLGGEPEPEPEPYVPTVTDRMVQLVIDTYAEHVDFVTRDGCEFCAECDAPLTNGALTQTAHACTMAAAALQDALRGETRG